MKVDISAKGVEVIEHNGNTYQVWINGKGSTQINVPDWWCTEALEPIAKGVMVWAIETTEGQRFWRKCGEGDPDVLRKSGYIEYIPLADLQPLMDAWAAYCDGDVWPGQITKALHVLSEKLEAK